MRIFRCRICSSPCLAIACPSHCPFCGARRKVLVPAADFRPLPLGELTETSRKHLGRLLELFLEDGAFCRAASKVADSEEGRALFGALADTIAQQALVVGTLLGDPPARDELYETGDCAPSHTDNLREASHRAGRTREMCRSALDDAEEERVREVLEALLDIRQDHLSLFGDD